jgi:hypothetical protein
MFEGTTGRGDQGAKVIKTVTWRCTSVSSIPISRISHYLICSCIYIKISVLALNSNSVHEQCFAKMDVLTISKWQTCNSFMGMLMTTAGIPGMSTSSFLQH